MNQYEFVESCLAKYRWESLPEGQAWEEAHYPIPECLGGTETVSMWSCDHTVQGILQSEELGHPCISHLQSSVDMENLRTHYPGYLDRYKKVESLRGKIGGSKGGTTTYERHPEEMVERRKRGGHRVHELYPGRAKELGALSAKKISKPVRCVETGEVYASSREAFRQTGIPYAKIGQCCLGNRKRTGGYHWEFA